MRYKRVMIHPYLFVKWFEEGNEIHAKCIKGLPKDSKFAYIYQSDSYWINVVFEHESFEKLKDGDLIPILKSPIFEQLSCAPVKPIFEEKVKL